MDKFTIVLVHGTGGYDADWFPNIAEALEKRRVPFTIPTLPTKKPIFVDTWLKELHKTVKKFHAPIVFVGYSLGTRTVLLYLEKYQPRVQHVFFVSAFSNDTKNALRNDNDYPSFFTHKINTKNILQNVPAFTILHSTDDDSIPYEQAIELSGELSAELITFQGKGHFCKPEYFKDVLSVLEKKLGI